MKTWFNKSEVLMQYHEKKIYRIIVLAQPQMSLLDFADKKKKHFHC